MHDGSHDEHIGMGPTHTKRVLYDRRTIMCTITCTITCTICVMAV